MLLFVLWFCFLILALWGVITQGKKNLLGLDIFSHDLSRIIVGLFILIVALATIVIVKRRSAYRGYRFAPGSVGKDDDMLGVKDIAANYAKSLQGLGDYVNVVGVFGEMGSGKSSLVRMIIEKLERDSFLYSYISLTETNETKDFEKLFQERWFEAIKKSYPFKLNLAIHFPLMEAILRETSNGFYAAITRLLNFTNIGLFPTKVRVHDDFLGSPKPTLCSNSVGKLFGHIPFFFEKRFVVVVDELERAQIDEIYRVIEIIERFKYEGRTGLPIQIIFLLCISIQDLEEIINEGDSEKGALIRKFIFEDPKSVGLRIFVPTQSIPQKQQFLKSAFDEMINPLKLKEFKDIESHEIYSFRSKWNNFEESEKGALQFALSVFLSETPRVFVRTMHGVLFFLASFSIRDKQLGLPIRLADIIILEYIKIRYPYLISFFRKTVEPVRHYSEYGFNAENHLSHSYRDELIPRYEHGPKKEPLDLFAWIKKEVGVDIDTSEREKIEALFTLVAYRWLDFISSDKYVSDSGKDKYWESRSTSDPEKMLDWLSFSKETASKSAYRISREIYDRHVEKGQNAVEQLNGSELLLYARFLSQSNIKNKNILLQTLQETVRRLQNTDGKGKHFKRDRAADFESEYHDAVYRVIFLALPVIELEPSNAAKPSAELKQTWSLLKEFLYNEKVPSEAKITILNSFGNNERGSGDVHARLFAALQKMFKKGYKEEIKSTIKHVFDEVSERYLNGTMDIYDREENPFFVLYQTWSGKTENVAELKKIQQAAKRKLEKHSEFLEVYWNKFPFENSWSSYDDVLKSRDWFAFGENESLSMYVPLHELIKITKDSGVQDSILLKKVGFWSKEEVLNDGRLKSKLDVKDSGDTLKAILTKNALYQEQKQDSKVNKLPKQ